MKSQGDSKKYQTSNNKAMTDMVDFAQDLASTSNDDKHKTDI